MNVLLVQVDGTYPNLALMKLSAHHRARGDAVWLNAHPAPDLVYASSVYSFSEREHEAVRMNWPEAAAGGTGYDTHSALPAEVEALNPDYSLYPDYKRCIGFTSRGCRNHCSFCVVPAKEGRSRSVARLSDLWSPGRPRDAVLLDNDFFGQEEWRERLDEAARDGWRLNFNQGVNCRRITAEQAAALAAARYYNAAFTRRTLHTAWDNLREEAAVKRGLARLLAAGIPARHLTVYMLIGHEPTETHEEREYRRRELVALGCKPYPMVFNRDEPELQRYARWVVRRYCEFIPWERYGARPAAAEGGLFGEGGTA